MSLLKHKWLALILMILAVISIPTHALSEGWRQLESYAAHVAKILYSHEYHGTITTIEITQSQLENLVSTPVSLLPAPGAGKFYVVYDVVAQYGFGTGEYLPVGVDELDIAEGDNGFVQLNDNELINAVTNVIYQKIGQSIAGPADPANVINKPLTLANLSGTDISGGTGVLYLTIHYSIQTIN